jgi:hypothetical protein
MKFSKFMYLLIVIPFLTLVAGCAGIPPSKVGTHPPIITHTFAVERGQYGSVWKIYLEAEDPDGDMYRIVSVVDQVGKGYYQPDWINIKPQYQKKFKGYIQWNTFSSKGGYVREWTNLVLKVSVVDRVGNYSNEVIFPFTFETGVPDPLAMRPPTPFDQGDVTKMGNVMVDLIDPSLTNSAATLDRR